MRAFDLKHHSLVLVAGGLLLVAIALYVIEHWYLSREVKPELSPAERMTQQEKQNLLESVADRNPVTISSEEKKQILDRFVTESSPPVSLSADEKMRILERVKKGLLLPGEPAQ